MNGLINFRDFGGMAVAGAGTVRRDVLYRSGAFRQADAVTVAAVVALDFDAVVDLRYPDERQLKPSPWPGHFAGRLLSHSGEGDADAPHLMLFRPGLAAPGAVGERYAAFYSELPFDPDYQPLFARVFARLAAGQGRVLIHCSAGKDRTGIFCALLLTALGVAWPAIMDDYLISRQAAESIELRDEVAARAAHHEAAALPETLISAVLGVDPAYLDATFAAIRRRCGSVDAYLDDLGADRAALRRRFTS